MILFYRINYCLLTLIHCVESRTYHHHHGHIIEKPCFKNFLCLAKTITATFIKYGSQFQSRCATFIFLPRNQYSYWHGDRQSHRLVAQYKIFFLFRISLQTAMQFDAMLVIISGLMSSHFEVDILDLIDFTTTSDFL